MVDHSVLLAHVAVTLYMVGVIWFVQVVHYPLFDCVSSERFAGFEARHTRLTGRVVMIPMLVELVTGGWLAWRVPPGISRGIPAAGLGLLILVWLSTFLLQVPRHRRLGRGFDPAAHAFLVRSNWLRTAAWTVRGVLVLYMVSPLSG